MNSIKPFFKTAWLAVNPWRYDEIHDKTGGSTFKYFCSFIFFAFLIAIILLIPNIANFVNNGMTHFDNFNVEFNTSMDSAWLIPENNPFVTVDTRTSEGILNEGRILITDDYVYKKSLFTGKILRAPINMYEDVLAHPSFFIGLLILLLPGLLTLFYIIYMIKILAIILFSTIIAWIFVRLAKFELTFGNIFKSGLLASTFMVFIDLCTLPFQIRIFGAQYIAFAIVFIVGIIKAGNFEGHHPVNKKPIRRKKKNRKDSYVELKVPRD